MKVLFATWVSLLWFLSCDARPPLQQKRPAPSEHVASNDTKEWDLGVEYKNYLQEVVQVLESDPEFRRKLEKADVEKIRDGTIANELEFVSHHIRSQLDDIKRRELERLRHLAMKQFELNQGIDRKHVKIPSHVEIQSPTFETEDLKKLIASTTNDLEEADRMRRESFKRYEMEKKFEERERLNHIEDEEKRNEEEERMKKMKEKHRQHETPHHPMTKDQLEEVWEEQDHMRAEDWDPKTFFVMHDLNGDGVWDDDEIRMLFNKELDKVYDPNAPEDDMREREEEMERMREHVFRESDKNKDRLISFDEFMEETRRNEFDEDPGWKTLDDDQDDGFTDEEFRAYEMQRQREIQDMLNRGVLPPNYPYFGDIPPGAQPYQLPHQGQLGIPGQPAYHPPPHPELQPPIGGQQQFGQPQHQQFGQPQHQQFGQPQHQQFGQQPPVPQQQPQFGQQPPVPQQQPQQFGQQPSQFAQQPQQQFRQPQQQQPQQFVPPPPQPVQPPQQPIRQGHGKQEPQLVGSPQQLPIVAAAPADGSRQLPPSPVQQGQQPMNVEQLPGQENINIQGNNP